MSQVLNLGRLLCRSNFESLLKNHEVENCGNNCVSSPYLLKAFLHQFKQVNKPFLLKDSFKCESSSLIYLFQGCTEEYIEETECLVKERRNIYKGHIRQPQYQPLAVEEHLLAWGDEKFHVSLFQDSPRK